MLVLPKIKARPLYHYCSKSSTILLIITSCWLCNIVSIITIILLTILQSQQVVKLTPKNCVLLLLLNFQTCIWLGDGVLHHFFAFLQLICNFSTEFAQKWVSIIQGAQQFPNEANQKKILWQKDGCAEGDSAGFYIKFSCRLDAHKRMALIIL